MKIVDAVWEKRNLGVDCNECRVDYSDSLQDIKTAIEQIKNTEYAVARIPSNRIDAVQAFQSEGFQFIEAAITLENDLKKIVVPKRLQLLAKSISWEIMNEADLDNLYSEIRGNIFKTDRIILDPYFTKEQAANRYVNWTKDLVSQGNVPYKIMYNNDVVGFVLNKEIKQGVYDGLLAGTYAAFEGTGMGVCIQYAGIKSAMEKDATKYIGHVSANNPAVLKSLEAIGFEIKLIEYIFIKHN